MLKSSVFCRCVTFQVFMFVCFRVEMERRKKKAVKESTAKVKDEDPYGGSTDENTDAEEEEDKPIPELPGLPHHFTLTLTS